MNTGISAKSVVINKFEGQYLESHTSQADEMLGDFISHAPLKGHMVQNRKSKIPTNSLHDTVTYIRAGINGVEF